jgi:hypothetical protein
MYNNCINNKLICLKMRNTIMRITKKDLQNMDASELIDVAMGLECFQFLTSIASFLNIHINALAYMRRKNHINFWYKKPLINKIFKEINR